MVIVGKHLRRGFGLVEVMVGLAIGMIAMIVVMEVFAIFEGRKRTTTSGADAQNNGAISLYMIEQDVKMAGWGMDASLYAGCNNTYSFCDGDASCGGGTGALSSFASVQITDGGANPDTITIQYFANPEISTFRLPANTSLRSSMPQPSSELNVGSVSGCAEGDLVLVSQAGNCTIMQATHIQDQALKIQHEPGTSHYNPPASYYQSHPGDLWPPYTTGAKLSCFKPPSVGPSYKRTYSVNTTTRQLQRKKEDGATELVAPEIIDLQAQYGVAPVGSQAVGDSNWEKAVGGTWANPSMADAKRIKAIRVALVARSTQYEKPKPGESCSTTTSTMVSNWSTWAAFNTANYPSDWQCYRYKVFETVIPLRNVIWGNI